MGLLDKSEKAHIPNVVPNGKYLQNLGVLLNFKMPPNPRMHATGLSPAKIEAPRALQLSLQRRLSHAPARRVMRHR